MITTVRVYVAHPMICYSTPHAAESISGIAKALPGVELIDPEQMGWEADGAWLCDWTDLLNALDGLVVFGAADGTVGAGCLREMVDALACGIPVAAWHPQLHLTELAGVALLPRGSRSARRTAYLAHGASISAATFPRRQATSHG